MKFTQLSREGRIAKRRYVNVLALVASIFALVVLTTNPSTSRAAGPAFISTTAIPEELDVSTGGHGRYDLRMASGSGAISFGIELVAAVWPENKIAGSPLTFTEPTMSGDGTIIRGATLHGDPRPGICVRGPIALTTAYQVTLPANTEATVSFPFSLTETPWFDTPIQPSFNVYPDGFGTYLYEPITTPAVFANDVGGWIDVWPAQSGRKSTQIKVKRGKSFRLAGRATPARRGRIQLSVIAGSGEKPITKTIVRSNKRGRFVSRKISIPARGAYQIEARWLKSAGRKSCGLQVKVS